VIDQETVEESFCGAKNCYGEVRESRSMGRRTGLVVHHERIVFFERGMIGAWYEPCGNLYHMHRYSQIGFQSLAGCSICPEAIPTY